MAKLTQKQRQDRKVYSDILLETMNANLEGRTADYTPYKATLERIQRQTQAAQQVASGAVNGGAQGAKQMPTAAYEKSAQQAQREYDAYVQSDTYKQKQATAYRQKLLQAAMVPGASIGDAPLRSFDVEDPTERSLRAKRDFYKLEAQKRKDQEITQERMREFDTWDPEDQEKLQTWIRDGGLTFGTITGMTDPQTQAMARIGYMELSRKYGAETVTRMEEMLRRFNDEQQASAAREAAAALPDNAGAGALGFVAARTANFAGNFTSPMEVLMEMTRKKTGEYSTMNPYGAGQLPGIFAGALDQRIAENIRTEDGQTSVGGEVLATLYQAGASAADSLLRAYAGGGNKNVSRALIAAGSFGRGVSEYSAQGASPAEALLMGTFDAGLELLTEEVSLDRIIKQAQYAPGSFGEWLKNMAISGGIEVSEEELSFLGSTILQAVVLGDKSEYNQKIGRLAAEGMDPEAAVNQANREWLMEGGQIAIQSWLSGSMMSGVSQTGAVIDARKLGKTLERHGVDLTDTDELLEAGEQAEEGSDMKELSRQLREKEQKQGAVSTYDQGRLYRTAMDSGEETFQQVVQRQWEDKHRQPGNPAQEPGEATPEQAPETQIPANTAPGEMELEATEQSGQRTTPGSDNEVGRIDFQYNHVNPARSYFKGGDGEGKYTLYDDGTVDTQDFYGISNNMEGWRNNGIFNLYDVTVDGQSLSADDELPDGYYEVEAVTKRPRVKESYGGFFVQDKGEIRLVKPGQKKTAATPVAEQVSPVQRQIMDNMDRALGFEPERQKDQTRQEQEMSRQDQKVRKSLERLSRATGRKVEVYSRASGKNGVENGYFQNGTIHVNTQGKDTHIQVFSHELTHSVELADSYRDLSDLIFRRIEDGGVDLGNLRENKKKLYAGMGVRLSDGEVDSEIVAQYVADHLLTDERCILELTRENRSISEKIRGWLDKVLARMGNENAQERTFLRNARDLYAKALRETGGKPVRSETARETDHRDQNTQQDEDVMDWTDYREYLNNQLRAGEITDEYYDEQMEFIREQEEIDAMAPEDRRYSYAGEKAQTADLKALDQAKELERQEVAAETIRQQTGWFRGMDGKWRFEVDDSSMQYHRAGDARFSEMHPEYARHQELMSKWLYGELNAEEETEFRKLDEIWGREHQRLSDRVRRGNATLQNLIRHDALFEAYPELRGAKVVFADMEPGTRGRYDPQINTITISEELKNAPQETLLHEIQHAIQEIEGFTGGASVDYWKEQRREITETIRAARVNLDLWLDDIGYKEHMAQSIRDVRDKKKTMEQHWKDMAEFKANSEYARQIAACEAEIAEFQKQYDEITRGMTAYEQYENTAGEIEARDAAGRRNLTAEERKKTPPRLGDENTVFAEGGGISAEHVAETGTQSQYIYMKPFGEQLTDYQSGKMNADDALVLGATPRVLKEIGLASLPMTINQKHVNDALNGTYKGTQQEKLDHTFTMAELASLPKKIADPIAVIQDKRTGKANASESTIDVLVEMTVASGKQVLAAVQVGGNGRINGIRIDTNKVATVHGNADSIYRLIDAINENEKGNVTVFYINNDKTTKVLQRTGNPIPSGLSNLDGFIHSINDSGSPVKGRVVNAIESQQFKRWFGDWHNHPENSSKVVDNDGTPRVVYHGTDAEFNVFHSQSGEYWFSENEDYAEAIAEERGGGAVKAVYLNMRNPYRAKLPPGQFTDPGYEAPILRAAKAGGHDGVIIENDTTNPLEAETFYVVFKPEQIKSATDNVGTYDSSNPDIRYSLSPVEDGQEQQETQAKSVAASQDPAEAPERKALPKKALGVLEGAERALLADIGEKMYVPRFARRDALKPILQEISNAYLRDGTVSQELADELFDKAYASGIVVDAEFYQQYEEIKRHLRNTAVTISKQDQGDIADFRDFRRRAWGSLKIVNAGGLPVDTAYAELHGMAPELFPERITHPADQLQHMLEVARSIQVSEKNIQEYFGESAEEFRQYARGQFQNAVQTMAGELRKVKRYGDEAQAKAQKEETPVTYEEAVKAYGTMKDARRNYERVAAKVLLTDADQIEVGRLLKGEILPEHLDPEKHNVEDIIRVYEAKREYEECTKQISRYRRHLKDMLRQKADGYLETALDWKDKTSGAAYSRETMRRNIRDIVKDRKLADAINDEYFETVHTSEAEATRFKNELRDRVRKLNLTSKVKRGDLVSESHAVQLYGEAMDNIEMIRKTRGRMKARDGKTLQEWQGVIEELFRQSPGLDRGKIERAVEEFRSIYDELYTRMNEVRVRNGYEPVNYRKGYFPHFQAGEGEGMLIQFGKAMGIDTQVDALPTTINGLTHSFRPGIQWFGNAQQRLGFNTTYDALQGFDKYIEGVANVIFHTENIQKLRALESQIRYRTSDEGIRKQVDAVHEDSRLTEEEKQMKIEEIYKKGKFTLSRFVDELSEYTNLLAGKKSRLDRTAEALMGRRFYTIMKNFESRVGANMIAGNLGSALTNFIPLTQAGAQLDRNMILKGMWDTLKSYKEDDGLVGASSFLTNRRGSDPLVRKWTEKVSGALGTPMELIDNFVSGSIVRAAYQQNLRQGMSEAEAMYQADIFASGVMADRSKGSMPTLFESRNPFFKAFTQFQLEVNNQFSEVFKDLPRSQREKGLAALAGVLLKYFLGAFLYNEVYEYFVGRRPAMDPIGILNGTVGDWTGYELPNLVEWGINAAQGKETSFETERVGFGEAAKNLGTEVLGQLPFSSGLTLLGIETDGGRIAASAAVPDLTALWDAATTEGWSGKKRWHEAQKELNKLAYVLPPFAGGQFSKTVKGIKAYFEGGSYGMDAEGNETLQYPIFREEDDFGTLVRAALLGKNSLPQAQEWVDSGFDGLNARQTAVYKDMQETGVRDREAFDLIRRLESVEKTETRSKAELQREMLLTSELNPDAVAVAYYGLLADEKTRTFMDGLTDQGADAGETARTLMRIQDAEDTNAKREAIMDATLSDEEKHAIYREKISEEKEDEISQLRSAGLDFDTFLQIQNEYGRINREDLKAGQKAREFSRWINRQDFTDHQAKVVRENFHYFSMVPAAADRYDNLVSAGLSEDKAYDIATQLEELKPAAGKKSVNDYQKMRVIVSSGMSERDQMRALEQVVSESTYEKLNVCSQQGVTAEQYLRFRELLPQFDANGSGTYNQTEIKAALDSMGNSGDDNPLLLLIGEVKQGEGLTKKQKAALWQSATTAKPYRNPYDTKVGEAVYAMLNEKESETKTQSSFDEELLRQLMASMK